VETITIAVRAARPKNSDGDFIGEPNAWMPLYGAIVWPRASEEKDGGEVNIDGWNVKLDWGTTAAAIQSDAQLEILGEVHSVSEPPARYLGKAVILKTLHVST